MQISKDLLGGGQYYLHIIIDQFSKYPEVDIVTSTSFNKLKTVLDRVFATHGIPETVTSDNGPPYPSEEMQKYATQKGFDLTPVSPEDPNCNGFAENFVKQMCKLVHTAVIEKKDPKAELYSYLLHSSNSTLNYRNVTCRDVVQAEVEHQAASRISENG